MPSQQTIIWTVLPNNFTSDNARLKLSIFVSPRLEIASGSPSPGSLMLRDYPDFANWPNTVSKIKFSVVFRGGITLTENNPDPQLAIVRVVDNPFPNITNPWLAVFDQDMPVSAFNFDDYSMKGRVTYPVADVSGFIRTQYTDAAASATPSAPATSAPTTMAAMANNIGNSSEVRAVSAYQAVLSKSPISSQGRDLGFHRLVSALGDYPEILKRMGLIIELELPPHLSIQPAGDVRIRAQWLPLLEPIPDAGGQDKPSTFNQTLWTKYILDRTAHRFLPASRDEDQINRMLKLDRVVDSKLVYNLEKFDSHAEALKLQGFATNFATNTAIDHKEGFPSLRSAGIALFRRDLAQKLKADLDIAAENDTRLQGQDANSIVLFSDDLTRGYRVDISYLTNPQNPASWSDWFSLHKRDGTYTFLKLEGSNTVSVSDEGWISLGAVEVISDQTPNPALAIHETIFRWEGWSLSVPRPGKALYKNRILSEDEADIDSDPRLQSKFKVPPGTLPRLRFGQTYRLRARVVDLAGNSHSLSNVGDTVLPAALTRATKYGRYEVVTAPQVVLREPLTYVDPTTNVEKSLPGKEGESFKQLVIRSNFNTTAAAPSRRHIVPEKVSQSFAEKHGLPFFESTNAMNPAAFNEIKRLDGSLRKVHESELITLPYLPDPLSHTLVIYGLPGSPSNQPYTLKFTTTNAEWPNARPWLLHLTEGSGPPQITNPTPTTEGVLTVFLPKAEVATIKISSRLKEEDLKMMGLWHWLEEKFSTPATLNFYRDHILNGCNEMFTPCREITLVHAVRQPLFEPQFQGSGSVPPLSCERTAGNTSAKIIYDLKIPAKSSQKLELLASWNEWIDEGSGKAPPRLKYVEHPAFEHPLPPTGGTTVQDIQGTFNGHHQFDDTKHRKVDYSFRATSRFADYFSTDAGSITRDSEKRTLHIPSSKRTDAPKIHLIIPTFGWTEQTTEKSIGDAHTRTITRKRHGNGLRVYLQRPWYETGEDELLGVVLIPEGMTGVPPESLKPFVTRIGKDPIWDTAYAEGYPDKDRFLNTKDVGSSLPLQEAGGTLVDVAGHAVNYDEEQKLWFSDILINPKYYLDIDDRVSYFPFVRMVLARYQRYALEGLHLSPVVISDFAQLAPDRTASMVLNFPNFQYADVEVTGDFHVPTRLTVSVESARPYVEGDLKWSATSITGQVLTRSDDHQKWTTRINLNNDSGEFRLVIKEYEQVESDTGSYDRLVYAVTLQA